MHAGSRQWWHAVVTVCCTGAWLDPPCSRPTLRQASSSSRPFRLLHAATHALHPVQESRSTRKPYCSPALGRASGISAS